STFSSVPQETLFSRIVVVVSPGRLGSSNLSVYRINSLGLISTNSPPKECPLPVLKLVKVILNLPPWRKSICCTVHKKPYGGYQYEFATGSAKALKTFSGLA